MPCFIVEYFDGKQWQRFRPFHTREEADISLALLKSYEFEARITFLEPA